jgi:hypothetical protein
MRRKLLLIPFMINLSALILTQLLISHELIYETNPIARWSYGIFGNFFVQLLIWTGLYFALPRLHRGLVRITMNGEKYSSMLEKCLIVCLTIFFLIDFANDLIIFLHVMSI